MDRIFVLIDSMKTGAEIECAVATPYKYLSPQTPTSSLTDIQMKMELDRISNDT
jgi:hypothetical protein